MIAGDLAIPRFAISLTKSSSSQGVEPLTGSLSAARFFALSIQQLRAFVSSQIADFPAASHAVVTALVEFV
jgi:hypothetical protein